MEWQKIETAPKNKEILLFCPETPDSSQDYTDGHNEFITVGMWGKHNHVPLYGWMRWEKVGDEEVSEIYPSHWAELPKAPE